MKLRYKSNPLPTAATVYRDDSGTERTEPIFPASLGALYRPLACSIRVSTKGALEHHYLIRQDSKADELIGVIYEEASNFEVIDAQLENEWMVLHSSPSLFIIGNIAVRDLETIHNGLVSRDKIIEKLIIGLTSI